MKTHKSVILNSHHRSGIRVMCQFGAILLLGLIPSALQAVSRSLPTAERIFEDYVIATGGRGAYEKIQNRITKSKIELPAMGISMTMTIYQEKPNKSYIVQESAATGKTESGTDGFVAWQNSAMTGPQLKRDSEKADVINASTMDRFTYWRTAYQSAACTGLKDVNGRPCYVVVAVPVGNGSPQTLFFDKVSKLLVKVAATVKSPMGSIRLESELSDYRKVDGILLPHTTRVTYVDMKRELLFTVVNYEHNSDIPATRFQAPSEIKALAKIH